MNIAEERPLIALVPGDCTGIGPEQTARLLSEGRMAGLARLILIGDRRVIERGMRQAGVRFDLDLVSWPGEARFADGVVPMIDLGNIDPEALPVGEMNPESGRLTGETLQRATEFAIGGEIDAITFAPLNKQAMFKGGWQFPDEHKMFAHFLDHSGPFSEMNVLDGQWMTRVTSHVSLREAIDQISFDSICRALRLADRTMKNAGMEKPRIAVAALNPHGGEGGLFGREEIEIIAPAVKAMAEEGIDCKGPYPSDTVYLKAFAGEFDGVTAMYHDQGQIATKLKGFNKGVTVTAGLDTIFTTPAHGTAYDIAGRGIADIGAFESTVSLAAALASQGKRQAVGV